jgi:hypothetical protein
MCPIIKVIVPAVPDQSEFPGSVSLPKEPPVISGAPSRPIGTLAFPIGAVPSVLTSMIPSHVASRFKDLKAALLS